jgi:hypothetical protein
MSSNRPVLSADQACQAGDLESLSAKLQSEAAKLRSEAANHATERLVPECEAHDSVAVTADRQVVSGDGAPQPAVRGAEGAHRRAMSSALITLAGDRASQ